MYTQYTSDTNHPKHFQDAEGKYKMREIINKKDISMEILDKNNLIAYVSECLKDKKATKYYEEYFRPKQVIYVYHKGDKRKISSIWVKFDNYRISFTIYLLYGGMFTRINNDKVRILENEKFLKDLILTPMQTLCYHIEESIKKKINTNGYKVQFNYGPGTIISTVTFTMFDKDSFNTMLTNKNFHVLKQDDYNKYVNYIEVSDGKIVFYVDNKLVAIAKPDNNPPAVLNYIERLINNDTKAYEKLNGTIPFVVVDVKKIP